MWGFSLKRLGNLEVVLKDKTKNLPCVLVRLQTPDSSPYGKMASKKDRSIYIYIYKYILYNIFSE